MSPDFFFAEIYHAFSDGISIIAHEKPRKAVIEQYQQQLRQYFSRNFPEEIQRCNPGRIPSKSPEGIPSNSLYV